jgi:hypothetical protein
MKKKAGKKKEKIFLTLKKKEGVRAPIKEAFLICFSGLFGFYR